MIYTLTTNPAIDMNISTDGLAPMIVNRTREAVYTPNGKGLNVSFVLQYYNIPTTILGFFGGFSGKYIVDEALKKGCTILPTWIEDITRINIFLFDGEKEYKMVNEGSYVPKVKQEELLACIQHTEDMEYLVISGSLPKGINPEYYQDILRICEQKGIKVILDISSKKLKNLLSFHPYLIKPNDEEIQDIFGLVLRDEADVIDALAYLYEQGAQNILLTLGAKGSYFYNGKHVYYASAVTIKLLSSACAGDAALAGFMSVWLKDDMNIEEALKRSAAIGANVAESNALGNFERVEEYQKQIHIRMVK